MKLNKMTIRGFVLVFMALTLVQCGKDESESEKAKFQIIPAEPIVITADIVSDGQVISAPWFEFRVKIKNETKDKFTIVAMQATVTGLDSSDNMIPVKYATAPSSFNFTLKDDVTCEFSHFGTFEVDTDPDSTGQVMTLEGAKSICYDVNGDGTPETKYTPTFRIPSNPPGGATGDNFRYTVELKPLGWYGDRNTPTDRFEKSLMFYTQ
ncbi:MAG TPA: hypothetical protein PKC28_14795 [Bdellovibrionales bacterium]|nr:hypothetical protein [Bdellovibrionales bacterium]